MNTIPENSKIYCRAYSGSLVQFNTTEEISYEQIKKDVENIIDDEGLLVTPPILVLIEGGKK